MNIISYESVGNTVSFVKVNDMPHDLSKMYTQGFNQYLVVSAQQGDWPPIFYVMKVTFFWQHRKNRPPATLWQHASVQTFITHSQEVLT